MENDTRRLKFLRGEGEDGTSGPTIRGAGLGVLDWKMVVKNCRIDDNLSLAEAQILGMWTKKKEEEAAGDDRKALMRFVETGGTAAELRYVRDIIYAARFLYLNPNTLRIFRSVFSVSSKARV